MATTFIPAHGFTLPAGSPTISAGFAPGLIFTYADVNGNKTWVRAGRVWADGSAVTVEVEPGPGPPPQS